MIWQLSSPATRVMRRARFCLLVLVALFSAHDAVYLAEFGFGDTFAAVMRRTGHDAYWPVYMLLVGLAAALLVVTAATRIGRLRLRLASLHPPGQVPTNVGRRHEWVTDAPSYRRELHGLWIRLLVVIVVAFVLQENAEHSALHGHTPGLGVLVGPENPLAVPALVAATFLLAAVGALVRWRIAVLGMQVARAGASPTGRAGLHARGPAAGRWIAAAVCALYWTIARQDPGRAPPLVPVAG